MDATAIGGIGDISDDFLPTLRDRIEKELGIPGAERAGQRLSHPPAGPAAVRGRRAGGADLRRGPPGRRRA